VYGFSFRNSRCRCVVETSKRQAIQSRMMFSLFRA